MLVVVGVCKQGSDYLHYNNSNRDSETEKAKDTYGATAYDTQVFRARGAGMFDGEEKGVLILRDDTGFGKHHVRCRAEIQVPSSAFHRLCNWVPAEHNQAPLLGYSQGPVRYEAELRPQIVDLCG